MERLTIRNCDGSVSQPMDLRWADALDRLAAYEDTGLTPEKIEKANKVIASAFNLSANSGTDMLIERLKEIIRAESEGRLLVLPCKVGDEIFELVPKCKPPFGVCLFEGGLGMARCDNRRCKAYIQDREFCLDDLYEIGKTVFLTREEAEEAMRKGEKDDERLNQ